MRYGVALTALALAVLSRAADPPSIASGVVKKIGTGKTITLDSAQRRELTRELALLKDRHPGKGVLSRVAPDCRLDLVYSDQTRKTFEIYGRIVLLNTETDESWQFYFGRTVLNWIAEAQP
jgi:hypothetical protein